MIQIHARLLLQLPQEFAKESTFGFTTVAAEDPGVGTGAGVDATTNTVRRAVAPTEPSTVLHS